MPIDEAHNKFEKGLNSKHHLGAPIGIQTN